MKRRFINPEENTAVLIPIDLKCTELREPSVVDEFHRDPIFNENGEESVSFSDPIYILFNQQRLNKLGSSATQSFFDSLQPKSDALAELRNKCSDDDLMKMVKSRHLQSPAEILAWCRYMEQNVDTFNKEVQSLVEAQAQQEKEKASAIVEPVISE